MQIQSPVPRRCKPALPQTRIRRPPIDCTPRTRRRAKLRKTFDSFVGETFYGQMLSSMRKTVGKAAYFDGGRAEEIFTGQLDQVIAQKLAESTAQSFSGPMFDLFSLQHK